MSSEVLATPASLDQFARLAHTGSLYAVLDACDEPAVLQKCLEVPERAVSLYQGPTADEYAHVAPYLITLDKELIEWIAERLWEQPWGIFIYSEAGREGLRGHLRRFLIVRLPDKQEVLFRFYDPRVLRTFLETSNTSEIETFFGPVRAFAIGVGASDNLTLFRPRTRG